MICIVKSDLYHDGNFYPKGAEIDLPEAVAESLKHCVEPKEAKEPVKETKKEAKQ